MTDKTYISTRQAAELLGRSPRTLAKWRVTNRGPRYYRLSRASVCYAREEVLAWLETKSVEPEMKENER